MLWVLMYQGGSYSKNSWDAYQPVVQSRCVDLLGMPYRLGGNGTDGTIDCIHLTYAVLKELNIAAPAFNYDWYEESKWTIARDMHRWGKRIDAPRMDGDVLILPSDRAFAAVWESGILFINRASNRVAWCPLEAFQNSLCFRSKEIYATSSGSQKLNTESSAKR